MADFESLEKQIGVLGEAIKLTNESIKLTNSKMDEGFKNLENQIDTLAIATAKGFEDVHKEIDEVKGKVTNLEAQADIVDQKLERIDRNIGTLMDATVGLETRVTKLEAVA